MYDNIEAKQRLPIEYMRDIENTRIGDYTNPNYYTLKMMYVSSHVYMKLMENKLTNGEYSCVYEAIQLQMTRSYLTSYCLTQHYMMIL
jgi:hypothetical protein